jgi:hypothetical protein
MPSSSLAPGMENIKEQLKPCKKNSKQHQQNRWTNENEISEGGKNVM